MSFRLFAIAFYLLLGVSCAEAQTTAPAPGNAYALGIQLLNAGKLDSAKIWLEHSAAEFRLAPENDTLQHRRLASALQYIGSIYQEQGQPEKALASQLEALRIRREYKLLKETVDSYGSVSALMLTQNRCEEALRYLERGIEEAKATGSTYNIPALMKFQGLAEFQLKHYDKAETTLLAALEEAKTQQAWAFASDICNSLAASAKKNPTLSHHERKEKMQMYLQMGNYFRTKIN